MKKIYSIILLFTFTVGTLQPIMPMIEYQLFKGDLIELLAGNGCPSEKSCDMIQCFSDVDCPSCDHNQKLLDTNYYPLALRITTVPDPRVFLIGKSFDLPIANNVTSPTILPKPPPPWLG